VRVRPATLRDLPSIALIGGQAFSGLRPATIARRWVKACFLANPRTEYWVAEAGAPARIVGYILWTEKGGFRERAVLELEQIAVSPDRRGRGIGGKLIRASLQGVKSRLRQRGSTLKLIEVTTGSTQNALAFYRRVLDARPVAKIPSFFRGDEYILITRLGRKG